MTDDIDRADALVSDLAKVLERRRQEVAISQEELAKRAGISRTYLSDIERGLRNISVTTLTKLAQAMNTTASALLAKAELASEATEKSIH
jgi:transcriptional regulator with XRE-family HTH domain